MEAFLLPLCDFYITGTKTVILHAVFSPLWDIDSNLGPITYVNLKIVLAIPKCWGEQIAGNVNDRWEVEHGGLQHININICINIKRGFLYLKYM